VVRLDLPWYRSDRMLHHGPRLYRVSHATTVAISIIRVYGLVS